MSFACDALDDAWARVLETRNHPGSAEENAKSPGQGVSYCCEKLQC